MEERTRGDGNKGVTMARGGEGAGVGVTLPTWRFGHWPRWGLGTPLLSCDLQAEGPGDGEGRHPLPQGEGSGGGAGQCLDQVGWLAFIDLQPHHKVWATEDTCQSLERGGVISLKTHSPWGSPKAA